MSRKLSVNCAGCKFYREASAALVGSVNPFVSLHCEQNQYDRYAVCVEVDGVQVGHVPKEHSQLVTRLLQLGLIESVQLESSGFLRKDPTIPRFRIRIVHKPILPGVRESRDFREGYEVRINDARDLAELKHIGDNIAKCHRLRNEDKETLRAVYIAQCGALSIKAREKHEPFRVPRGQDEIRD